MPARCSLAVLLPALPVAFAFGLALRASGEPRTVFTGFLENETAYRVRSPHWTQKSQTRLEVDAETRLLDSLRLRMIGRLLYDPRRHLVGDDPDFGQQPIDRWQVGGTRSLEAELREIYLDWRVRVRGARLDLRIGKQQVVWGQSMGLRILDVVNAQDYREFLLDDFIDARIPTFGVRVDASVRGWKLQAFAQPDFEPDRLADPGTEFAIDPELPGFLPSFAETPPLAGDRFVTSFPVTLWFPGSSFPVTIPVTMDVGPLVAGYRPLPFPIVVIGKEEKPEDWSFAATSFGLRIARVWKGFDLSLHYLDGPDPNITFRRWIDDARITATVTAPVPGSLLPAGFRALPVSFDIPVPIKINRVQPDHVRIRTLGASFATAHGDFSFWGEGALSFGRALVVDDLQDEDGVLRRPDLRYVLAADWMGWPHLFANVQWIQRIILNHHSSIEGDRVQSFASLLLRFDLLDDSLFPQLFVLYGLNDKDSMIRPSLEWKITDRFSLTVGADLFTGSRRGLFGQFAHRRTCVEVPEIPGISLPGVAIPEAGGCLIETPPGRPGRVFLRLRYAFQGSF